MATTRFPTHSSLASKIQYVKEKVEVLELLRTKYQGLICKIPGYGTVTVTKLIDGINKDIYSPSFVKKLLPTDAELKDIRKQKYKAIYDEYDEAKARETYELDKMTDEYQELYSHLEYY